LKNLLIQYIDIDRIYRSTMDYGLVTFELGGVHPVKKFKEEIDRSQLHDYILASACFPIFRAQRIDKKIFTDGGVGDNLPINMLAARGYRQIIAVDLHGIGIRPSVTADDIYVKTIRPTVSLGGLLDFNKERMRRNTLMGYMDTLKAFHRLQGDLYHFEPDEFKQLLDKFNSRTVFGLEKAAEMLGMDRYEVYSARTFCTRIHDAYQESVRSQDDLKIRAFNIREIPAELEKLKHISNKKLMLNRIVAQARVSPLHLAGIENALFTDYADAARAILELEQMLVRWIPERTSDRR
jgi:NTE family protein